MATPVSAPSYVAQKATNHMLAYCPSADLQLLQQRIHSTKHNH